MFHSITRRLAALALFGAAFAALGLTYARPDDTKPDDKKIEEKKPAIDLKDVRMGPPPELAELRKSVEEAARKGENVDEIRKQLDALEKVLAGKAWVKPKPIQEPPADVPPRVGAFPNPIPFPNLVPFPNPGLGPVLPPIMPGFDPRMQEAMQKAQELMLKAIVIRGEDPAKAEELMKQARELMGVPGGLMIAPGFPARGGLRGNGSRLGVRVEKVPAKLAEVDKVPAGRGILVAEVLAGTPADKAGLKDRDIIIEFDGKPVGDDPTEFVRTVFATKPGEKVDIVYLRNGKKGEAKAVPLADASEPRVEVVPFLPPLVRPIDPLLAPRIAPPPAGLGGQNSSSVSVRVENGNFTIRAEVNGVKFVMEGAVGDTDKAVPTKIEVFDGKKQVEAASVDKLPAEYRDRARKILENVKVGK